MTDMKCTDLMSKQNVYGMPLTFFVVSLLLFVNIENAAGTLSCQLLVYANDNPSWDAYDAKYNSHDSRGYCMDGVDDAFDNNDIESLKIGYGSCDYSCTAIYYDNLYTGGTCSKGTTNNCGSNRLEREDLGDFEDDISSICVFPARNSCKLNLFQHGNEGGAETSWLYVGPYSENMLKCWWVNYDNKASSFRLEGSGHCEAYLYKDDCYGELMAVIGEGHGLDSSGSNRYNELLKKGFENDRLTSLIVYDKNLGWDETIRSNNIAASKCNDYDLPTRPLPNWMSLLREEYPDIKVANISIPGTHDSAAWDKTTKSTHDESNVNLHHFNIRQQLQSGIRFLDMRMDWDTGVTDYDCNDLGMWHGWADLSIDFTYALDHVYHFLNQNSEECIIMNIGYENDGASSDKQQKFKWCMEDIFKGSHTNHGSTAQWIGDNDGMSWNTWLSSNSNKWIVNENVMKDLKLSACDGKIMVIRGSGNCWEWSTDTELGGLDWNENTIAYFQNDWSGQTGSSKSTSVKEYIDYAIADDERFYFNFLSGTMNGNWEPYDLAEEVIPTISSYIDSVTSSTTRTKLGVLIMDFPFILDRNIVYKIVESNFVGVYPSAHSRSPIIEDHGIGLEFYGKNDSTLFVVKTSYWSLVLIVMCGILLVSTATLLLYNRCLPMQSRFNYTSVKYTSDTDDTSK